MRDGRFAAFGSNFFGFSDRKPGPLGVDYLLRAGLNGQRPSDDRLSEVPRNGAQERTTRARPTRAVSIQARSDPLNKLPATSHLPPIRTAPNESTAATNGASGSRKSAPISTQPLSAGAARLSEAAPRKDYGPLIGSEEPAGIQRPGFSSKLPTPHGVRLLEHTTSGRYEAAVRLMNGMAMGEMLSYVDRLEPPQLAKLEEQIQRTTGVNSSRLEFALAVVERRDVPTGSGLPEDQLRQAGAFTRNRRMVDSARSELAAKVTEQPKADALHPPGHPKQGQPVNSALPNSHPRIVEYHQAGGYGRMPDDKPWCSSFVNFVMKQVGEAGSGRPNAQSWLTWGKEVDRPMIGAIAVVRGSDGRGSDAFGHVGIVVGVSPKGEVVLLGGNQDNRVSEAIEQRPIFSYRVPLDYDPIAADFELPTIANAKQKASDR